MSKKVDINKSTKIGILYGGLSHEREVSLRSGKNCLAALQRLGYGNAALIDADKEIINKLKQDQIEIAFLALHGGHGEDGTIQGLLELLEIPYTGSGLLGSALSMSKPLTKQVLAANNIPYPPTIIVHKNDLGQLDELIKPILPFPLIIKPIREGSSVGVHKIDDVSKLKSLTEETITKYGGALLERYISGAEITVGVLEESHNGRNAWALPVLELRPKSKAGFYDYEAKYTKGMTEFILPAELDAKTTALVQEIAIRTFRALWCHGYARVDMMVDKSGQPYVLEVNTLPGMTDTSDLPAMAEVAGITYDELVQKILDSACLKN